MPSAELKPGARIAVIGAGIVGSSCAWHLQRAGFNVTLVDPVDPGQSTSYGNAACISTSQITPFSYPGVIWQVPGWLFDPLGPMFVRWRHLPSVAPWMFRFWRSGTAKGVDWSTRAQARMMNGVHPAWDEILAETGQEHMRVAKGVIAIYEQYRQFEADRWMYDYKDELGFEWQHLSSSELRIMVPELDIGKGMAVYHPGWTHLLDPAEVTAAIARDGFARGVRWNQQRVRTAEVCDTGIRLVPESGQVEAYEGLVVAAGAWSNQFASSLDYKVPMTAKRGYHSMIGAPGLELEYPIMSMTRSFVMTPLRDGLRIAGTAEFAKLDAAPDYGRAKVLLAHARRYFPALQENNVTEWMGQRPMMADSIPVISRSPSHRNVFYAFGHGHYGLTQGPLTGCLITDMVAGRDSGVEMADYDMARFRS